MRIPVAKRRAAQQAYDGDMLPVAKVTFKDCSRAAKAAH